MPIRLTYGGSPMADLAKLAGQAAGKLTATEYANQLAMAGERADIQFTQTALQRQTAADRAYLEDKRLNQAYDIQRANTIANMAAMEQRERMQQRQLSYQTQLQSAELARGDQSREKERRMFDREQTFREKQFGAEHSLAQKQLQLDQAGEKRRWVEMMSGGQGQQMSPTSFANLRQKAMSEARRRAERQMEVGEPSAYVAHLRAKANMITELAKEDGKISDEDRELLRQYNAEIDREYNEELNYSFNEIWQKEWGLPALQAEQPTGGGGGGDDTPSPPPPGAPTSSPTTSPGGGGATTTPRRQEQPSKPADYDKDAYTQMDIIVGDKEVNVETGRDAVQLVKRGIQGNLPLKEAVAALHTALYDAGANPHMFDDALKSNRDQLRQLEKDRRRRSPAEAAPSPSAGMGAPSYGYYDRVIRRGRTFYR